MRAGVTLEPAFFTSKMHALGYGSEELLFKLQNINIARLVDFSPGHCDQNDFTVVSVNLPASGWSSNQQTVAVSGVTASTEIVVVSYSPGSYQAYTEAGVRATAQGAGSLTFACDEAPRADLVAEVMYA